MQKPAFTVLPAHGYQLIRISDDVGDPIVENRLSKPEVVLGFLVRQNENSFSVLPVTAFGVYDDGGCGGHALIRPDGTVDYEFGGELIFSSLHELKQYLRQSGAEVFQDTADDMAKDGDKKGAARMRHVARLHQEQFDKNEGDE